MFPEFGEQVPRLRRGWMTRGSTQPGRSPTSWVAMARRAFPVISFPIRLSEKTFTFQVVFSATYLVFEPSRSWNSVTTLSGSMSTEKDGRITAHPTRQIDYGTVVSRKVSNAIIPAKGRTAVAGSGMAT